MAYFSGMAFAAPEDPPERPAEPALRPRSLAASALFHGAILAALIGLWRGWAAPQEPLVQVVMVTEGPGAAGAAGGDAGGGGHAPDATPTAEAAAAPETPQQSEQPPVPVAKEAPLPAEPPRHKPMHKPQISQHKPVLAAHHPQPRPEPPQIAAAPSPVPAPGTPGAEGGPLSGMGAGQGAEGQGPGAVGDGPAGSPGDDYLERVRRWIRKYQRYPAEASRRKEEGTAVLDVTLARDGRVLRVAVERSSGFPLIDEAAVKAVYDASPVPPFPESYRRDQGTLVLPAIYSLGFFERLF